MDYHQARAFVKAASGLGSIPGLDNIKNLMGFLGNPQDSLSFIHVAGTNGKGSVIACLYSVLCSAGFRAGRYTSPALSDPLECFEAGGRRITRTEYALYMSRVSRAVEQMRREGMSHPTVFEIETAVAFLFFADKKCSPVLLETGMGGDLDATNIVTTTRLVLFTPIGMDHREYLGNTLAEIAEKKAGILKPGCLCLTSRQEPEVLQVIKRRCAEIGVRLRISDPGRAFILRQSVEGSTFRLREKEMDFPDGCCKDGAFLSLENERTVSSVCSEDRAYGQTGSERTVPSVCSEERAHIATEDERTVPPVSSGERACIAAGNERTVPDSGCGAEPVYTIPLAGPHQVENAVEALEALELLDSLGWPTTVAERKAGLAGVQWAGRFMVLDRDPLVIVDGAHNPAAVLRLEECVRLLLAGRRILYIIGVFRDKDYREILRIMAPHAAKILTIRTPDNPRALPADELAAAAREYHPDVECIGDPAQALERARQLAAAEDVILAFGSLSFIGDFCRFFHSRGTS